MSERLPFLGPFADAMMPDGPLLCVVIPDITAWWRRWDRASESSLNVIICAG
jgi:hypothetical protein